MIRETNQSDDDRTERTKLSPKELAAQWGKKPSTIIALIRQGELRAINASTTQERPRFLIDVADIAIFEQRRAVQPSAGARRRRSNKAEANGPIKYF